MKIISMNEFSEFAKQLIEILCDGKSTNSVSLNLGFQDNRVNRWLNGQREIYWEDFKKFTDFFDISIDEMCHKVGLFDPSESYNDVYFYKTLLAGNTLKELSSKLEVSLPRLYRWQKGEAVPKLKHILALLHYNHDLFSEFTSYLIGKKKSDHPLQQLVQEMLAERNYIQRNPVISALLRIVEVSKFSENKQAFQRIADLLHLSREEIEDHYGQLLKYEYIEKRSEIYWVTKKGKRINTRSRDKVIDRSQRKYWIDQASKSVMDLREGDAFGYLVYSSTPDFREKLRVKMQAFYQDVLEDIYASTSVNEIPVSEVEVFSMQNFSLFSEGDLLKR